MSAHYTLQAGGEKRLKACGFAVRTRCSTSRSSGRRAREHASAIFRKMERRGD